MIVVSLIGYAFKNASGILVFAFGDSTSLMLYAFFLELEGH